MRSPFDAPISALGLYPLTDRTWPPRCRDATSRSVRPAFPPDGIGEVEQRMRQGRSDGFGLVVDEHGRPGGDPDPATSRGLIRPCDLRQPSRDRPELTRPHQPPKWMGTVRVRTPPPKSGGGAGTGLARRGSEIASASNAGLPDEPIRRADSTWPDRAMVKATEAVPALAAPDG